MSYYSSRLRDGEVKAFPDFIDIENDGFVLICRSYFPYRREMRLIKVRRSIEAKIELIETLTEQFYKVESQISDMKKREVAAKPWEETNEMKRMMVKKDTIIVMLLKAYVEKMQAEEQIKENSMWYDTDWIYSDIEIKSETVAEQLYKKEKKKNVNEIYETFDGQLTRFTDGETAFDGDMSKEVLETNESIVCVEGMSTEVLEVNETAVCVGDMSTDVLEVRETTVCAGGMSTDVLEVNETAVCVGGMSTDVLGTNKTAVRDGAMSTEMFETDESADCVGEMSPEVLATDTDDTIDEEEFRALEQMLMCKVCLNEDLCIIFLPCSHLATCERCASVLHSCPVCRSLINESVKVNFE